MRKIFSIIIISLFVTFGYSQTSVSVREGDQLKPKIASNIKAAIGQDKTSFYTLRNEKAFGAKFWVEKFNKQTLTVEYSSPLDLIEEKDYYDGGSKIKAGLMGEELFVIYDLWNKTSGKKSAYIKTVNKSGSVGKRKELNTIESGESEIMFEYFFSNDFSSFILISLAKESHSATLYDTKTQKVVWTNSIPLELNGLSVRIKSAEIQENKDVKFTFVAGYKKEGTYKQFKANLKATGTKLSEIIEVPGLVDNKFYKYSQDDITTKDGKIVTAGMYVEKGANNDKGNSKELKIGVFFGIIDASGKISKETYAPLEKDVYDKLTYSIKGASSKDATPGSKSIVIKEIKEMSGCFYVICEHVYQVIFSDSYGGSRTDFNREIIVTKYSSEGKYEWMRIIPRAQFGVGDYDLMTINNKLNFIYIESIKNKDIELNNYKGDDFDVVQRVTYKANIVCMSIDDSGTMNKIIIPHTKEKECNYQPQKAQLFFNKDNELLVEFIGEEYNKFAVVTLN